ncbi:MAG TPA: DJ-1/PfpI family protein [Symbiobacteriaceae bacterium]|jgi:transcriptional regulator GlxA family with amidase domain
MMKVAVLLFDGVEELDFAGPFEVFGAVAEVFTVGNSREIRGSHGLKVTAEYTFADAPEFDVLVVPGGPVTRERPESVSDVEEYVRKMAPACRLVLACGTGSFFLARAGMLGGRSCTTHYRRRHQLAAQFPEVNVRYARVVSDGKVITTGGVSAGIDGALFAVSRLEGLERARKLAKQIEYPWHSSHVLHASAGPEPYEFPEESATFWAW